MDLFILDLLILGFFMGIRGLRLFPDWRWEKEVRWERTAVMGRQRWVKVTG
jgi:hypothetical protein